MYDDDATQFDPLPWGAQQAVARREPISKRSIAATIGALYITLVSLALALRSEPAVAAPSIAISTATPILEERSSSVANLAATHLAEQPVEQPRIKRTPPAKPKRRWITVDASTPLGHLRPSR